MINRKYIKFSPNDALGESKPIDEFSDAEIAAGTDIDDSGEINLSEIKEAEAELGGEAAKTAGKGLDAKTDDDQVNSAPAKEKAPDPDDAAPKKGEAPDLGGDADAAKPDKPEVNAEGKEVLRVSKDSVDTTSQPDSWKGYAKDLDIDVTEDTFDSFQEGINKKIESAKEEALTEYLSSQENKQLIEYGPEAKAILDSLKAGHNIKDIMNPQTGFEGYFKMDQEDLMIKVFESRGLDSETAKEEIAVLKENERLGNEYKMAIAGISQLHEEARAEKLHEMSQSIQTNTDKILELDSKNEQALVDAIMSENEYDGKVLPKEERQKVVDMWKSGEIRNKMNNPQFVKDMIFQSIFGKQINEEKTADAVATERSLAAEKKASNLHNLPPGRGGQRSPDVGRHGLDANDAEDPFIAWDKGIESGEEIVTSQ